jgi:hypothetical protein
MEEHSGIKQKIGEYKTQTESLIKELEGALHDFEKNGDIKKLNYTFKESLKQFQQIID